MEDAAQNKVIKIITALLLLFIAINLLILDIKIFTKSKDTAASIVANPTGTKERNETVSVKKDEASESAETALPTQAPQGIIQNQTSQPSVQEFYVPMGGDTTTSAQYQTLSSTQTLIDTNSYGTITQAYFIGGLSNPTGNGFVQAQLYDVTNQHPVWNSTITLTGTGPQTITSNPISLDPGANQYVIQLMSTLQYSGYIENAKVRILAQ